MTAIIPFDGASQLPAYLANRRGVSSINQDLIGAGANFAILSIKGKVFTLIKGSEKKLLTREIDGEEEAIQSLQVTIARANRASRVFYAKAYSEGDSDGAKPTCFSHDGIRPDPASAEKQCGTCQGCPQNVWGVRDGKGTACTVNTRLAIVDPTKVAEPFLLRVPPASRSGLADVINVAANRGYDYNMLVLRMSFDKEAATPKLVFKIAGLLDDPTYEKVKALYDDETTKSIVGVHEPVAAAAEVDTSELDAAIAARAAVKTAKAAAAPEVTASEIDAVVEKPKAEVAKPKAKPKAEPAPAPAATDGFMSELDALLGSTDD